jgi:hypothetical protein
MAPRSKHNLDVFRELVRNNKTRTVIIAEMSIKNAATFNSLLLRLMQNDKKYYAVTDSSKKVTAKKPLKATIGKNNNLALSSKMLEDSGFNAGDAFVVKVSKNKIVLTLVEE